MSFKTSTNSETENLSTKFTKQATLAECENQVAPGKLAGVSSYP